MMADEPDDAMSDDPLVTMGQDVLVSIILMGLVAVVGLVGNSIFLRSLVMYKNLRVDMFVIMGGLAVADILHLCIAVPAHIIEFLGAVQVLSTGWCKASRYFINATNYIAAYHLVALAVLRGIMLTNRGHASPTGRHALICTVVVWVVGLMATIPVIEAWTQEEASLYCYYSVGVDIEKEMWLRSAFSCFVPIAMIILIYLTTYYVGKRYFEDSYSRHEKQMSRLVSVVIICFVVCELPFRVTHLVKNNINAYPDDGYIKTLNILTDYFLCLLLVDKAMRPVLYSKLSSDLGECFDEIINCTYCHRYYSDTPKRQDEMSSANSRAPLTNGHLPETMTEEVV